MSDACTQPSTLQEPLQAHKAWLRCSKAPQSEFLPTLHHGTGYPRASTLS